MKILTFIESLQYIQLRFCNRGNSFCTLCHVLRFPMSSLLSTRKMTFPASRLGRETMIEPAHWNMSKSVIKPLAGVVIKLFHIILNPLLPAETTLEDGWGKLE